MTSPPGRRRACPSRPLPMTEETLLIPNTVAVVRGAPHPEAAQQLFEYLQRREVVQQLVAAHALEGLFRQRGLYVPRSK